MGLLHSKAPNDEPADSGQDTRNSSNQADACGPPNDVAASHESKSVEDCRREKKRKRVTCDAELVPLDVDVNSKGRNQRAKNGKKRNTCKRKVAFIVAYDGAPYYGWQRNKGVLTVTDEVENALHAAGLISEMNFGDLKKTSWISAARTDKGVSAAGNVVSLRVELPKEEGSDSPQALAEVVRRVNESLPNNVRVLRASRVSHGFSARVSCGERNYEYLLDSTCIGADNLQRFNEILQRFECPKGKWFHNYTVGRAHAIPPPDTARRLMRSVKCDQDLFVLKNDDGSVESSWVRIRIRGQSFMLHQIRKMISMAILVHRGTVPDSTIENSFQPDCLLNIPPAPPTDQPVTHVEVEEERERFKREVIFPSIARRAQTKNDMRIFFAIVDEYAASLEQMKENVAKPRKNNAESTAGDIAETLKNNGDFRRKAKMKEQALVSSKANR